MTDALILVDIQNDFLPGGSLAVPDGGEVIPVANFLIPRFDHVFATQDWHPADHGSFASQYEGRSPGETIDLSGLQQVLWPDHCVQDSAGAEFAADLELPKSASIVPKGTGRMVDSYSGFFDNGQRSATELNDALKSRGIRRVFVLGLATDYCVRFTALDAKQLGFETVLVEDGCRGVNLKSGDVDQALQEMADAGVQMTNSSELNF